MNENGYIEIEENKKLILPSEVEGKKKKTKRRKEINDKTVKKLKWVLIIGIALVLYIFYDNIIMYLLNILKQNPTIYNYYLIMEAEIKNNTLKGLFFVSILGSLFFLVLPSEALFIYYLSSTNYGGGTIIVLTLLGVLAGFTINYFFGRILGEEVLKFLFKKNFENYKERILKYGGTVLLIGSIIPGPIEVLAVFYGGFKFGYPKFLYLVFIGRFIKYTLLLIIFMFFWEECLYYYDSLLSNFLILKDLYI